MFLLAEYLANSDYSCALVGWGPEKSNFVFELTYNYGIKGYKHGNDLRYIAVSANPVLENAKKHNIPLETFDGHPSLVDPDGYRWVLIDSPKSNFVHYVALNSANLTQPLGTSLPKFSGNCVLIGKQGFWHSVLGMKKLAEGPKSVRLGYEADQTALEFHQLENGATVDHADAFGRVAIATAPGTSPIHKAVLASGDSIQHGPIKLETEGKATVEVIILVDRDRYEVCYVEMDTFDELSKPVEGNTIVDWAKREEFGGK